MEAFCKKIQLTIIVLSGCLLFPFVSFAVTNVTLLNASGGRGGSPFVDMAVSGGSVAAITVRSGSLIDSIQFTYRYGKKQVRGQAHGGNGGKSRTFKLKPGEVIIELSGKSGKYVDSLYIKTSRGRSKRWGGKGGSRRYKFTGSTKSPITGIWGRSGNLLDAIGAIKASKGGQSIETKGFANYKDKVNKEGLDCDRCENVMGLQFPRPAAQASELKPWLEIHNVQLGIIIRKLSGSDIEFRKYKSGEEKTCRSSLYCQVAYRRGAISYVTGAK